MIGTSHLSRNDSMYLGEFQIRQMEREYGPMCAWKGDTGNRGPRCKLPYERHTCDVVAFVKLQRELENKEAAQQLSLLKEKFEEDGIDGFGFIDTGFRILPPVEEEPA
ncbi:MAG: hypothetical protein ACXABD_15780 [Candidatus Thorarchaeota archaeon]